MFLQYAGGLRVRARGGGKILLGSKPAPVCCSFWRQS